MSNWSRRGTSRLRAAAHFGTRLGVGSLGALRLALVVQLLALGDSGFALDAAVFQVNLNRDQGQPLFPRNGQQLVDFPPVEQQLAIADGRVVLAVAVGVLADVRVEQPGLVAQHAGVGFLELYFAVLGRLHLGAGEHHAALEALQQEIVVEGLPVVAEDLERGVFLVSQIDLNARKPNCVNEFRWVRSRNRTSFYHEAVLEAGNAQKYVSFQSLNGDRVDQYAALSNASAGSQDQKRRQVPCRGADPRTEEGGSPSHSWRPTG